MRVFIIIIDILLIVSAVRSLMKASLEKQRGTNVASRFIRDNLSYRHLKACLSTGTMLTVVNVLYSIFSKEWYFLVVFVIGLALAVIAFMKMQKENKNQERIDRSRYITEVTSNAVGNTLTHLGPGTAEIGGAVVGMKVGGVPGAVAGAAIGAAGKRAVAAVGNSVKKTGGDLEGVESVELFSGDDWALPDNKHLKDFNNKASMLADTITGSAILNVGSTAYTYDIETFRTNAQNYGINVDEMSDEEIAQHFLRYAPEAALQSVSDAKSDIERADRIMKGLY